MKKTIAFVAVILLSLSTAAPAAETIKNWSAPLTWTPPSAQATGRSALVASPPVPFIPITPCRVADTRGNGFTGTYGLPFMAGGVPRNFTIMGQCGIPSSGVEAVSFNFTVTNTAGPGFLLVFPQGGAQPNVSTLNYVASQTIANAAVVPLGNGGLTAIPGVSGFDLLIDVNGYYSQYTVSGSFQMSNNAAGDVGVKGAENGTGGTGVYGYTSGTAGRGVYGYNGTATGFGVMGSNGPGIGVIGTSISNVGTKGTSSTSNGVWAESTSLDGLYAQGGRDGTYSVGGANGVVGISTGTIGDIHGVVGYDSTGSPSATNFAFNSGGLFFSQTGVGVWGASRYSGVYGQLYNVSGASVAEGFLGTTFGVAPGPFYSPWAVFANGNFGASGAKHFVEPHPTDAAKVIVYSSLEGREVGTYFRGTASIVNHEAVIVIPEDFRTVTAEEGLTIQVTPIGAYSQVYVESKDLNQIVIRGSQDVPFDYMVNGVRRAFKNFEPVQIGYEFMPRTPSDRMPLYLTEEAKARLISNGTYNPDGTVNMSTAERAGFTKIWADREAEAKAAAEKNAAKKNAKADQQQ